MNEHSLEEYDIDFNHILGKGEYSVVYCGVYTGLGNRYISYEKDVAIKIITNKKVKRYSLNNEIEISNYFKEYPHPNIVEFYDIIKKKDYTYIIMEYCDCGDLRSLLDELKKPIKEEWAQYFFSQFANGLEYLNKLNIIHRDLKPSNILLTKNRSIVKICDFGFAEKFENIKKDDTICGSPLYMAPETLNNYEYESCTDLWSVGLILYEILFLKHPYDSCNNIPELKSKINSKNIIIPPYDTENIYVSNECLSLLKGLLKKKSSDRITWDSFLNHPWIHKYINIISKAETGYSSTLKPVTASKNIIPKMDKVELNIIEDYCDNISSDEIFEFDIDDDFTYSDDD